MAAPGSPSDPTSDLDRDPHKYSFKGHPQPSVNDRLETAKNFLADEDPDRFLNFQDKIAEIEEFIADVEGKPYLIYDARQLRDVKIMVEEHRAWQKTVDDGWKDIKCRDRAPKNPFSNRLINADTTDLIKENARALGINGQMRDDAAPFTTEREDDHDDFLRAMRHDVIQNPDDVDEGKSLLYIESKAYSWAMQDPAFIPFWMHPTKGIPKEGLTDVDEKPWYQIPPPPPDYIKNRPCRGYMPDYLIKREDRINALLKLKSPTSRQFKELEDLLIYHYPKDLRFLYDRYLAHLRTTELASNRDKPRQLSKQEEKEREKVTSAFQDAQLLWLQKFASTGVYLVVRKPWQDVEVDLPGVFYIDHGILNDAQLTTLDQVQTLFTKLRANPFEKLNHEEQSQVATLVRDVQPKKISDLEKRQNALLLSWGVNHSDDLDDSLLPRWEKLEQEIKSRRKAWVDQIKAKDRKFEIRYLRPGELPEHDPSIIYLPWSMEAMPISAQRRVPDRTIPPDVIKLQDFINTTLNPLPGSMPPSRSIGDDGVVEFQDALIQFAYPKLRRLLIPWITIRDKRARGEPLSTIDHETFNLLDTQVRKLWNDWVRSLGNYVQPRIPRSQMLAESPDLLYWRLPTSGVGDPDVEASKNTRAINSLLEINLSQSDSTASQKFWEDLKNLLADVQYPALKRVFDNYKKAKNEGRNEQAQIYFNQWSDMFEPWVRSKLGHTISIKRPSPLFDPDDDPSVVYFHGPLADTRATNRLRLQIDSVQSSEELVSRLDALRNSNGDGNIGTSYIKHLQCCAQRTGSDIDRAILRWHCDYLLNGPLLDNGKDVKVNLEEDVSSMDPATWRDNFIDNDGVMKNFKKETSDGGAKSLTTPDNTSPGGSETEYNGDSDSPSTSLSLSSLMSIGFTRPPPSQRVGFKDPILGIDLRDYSTHIAAFESEIRDMFNKENDQSGKYTKKELEEAVRRGHELLLQFMPEKIYRMWQGVIQQEKIIAAASSGSRAQMVKDAESMRAILGFNWGQWCQEILLDYAHSDLYIRLSTNPEDQREGAALVFQPGITQREGDFRIVAPEDPTAPVGTSRLVYHSAGSTPSRYLDRQDFAYDQKLRWLSALGTRINELLQKRSNSEWLNWDDEEELLDKIYGFMPLGLQRMESEVWQLDQEMRDASRPRDSKKEQEYSNKCTSWISAYDQWLKSFPKAGITIGVGPGDYSQPGALFMEDPKFWLWIQRDDDVRPGPTRRRQPRSRESLKHIKEEVAKVNTLIQETPTSRDFAQNKHTVEMLLRSAYRHIGRRIRHFILHDLQLPQDKPPMRPEDQVLVETIEANAYALWKDMTKRHFDLQDEVAKQNDKRFRFVEISPGEIVDYFGSPSPPEGSATYPFPAEFDANCALSAKFILEILYTQSELTAARNRFRSLAARVRNRSTLSPDETTWLKSRLSTYGPGTNTPIDKNADIQEWFMILLLQSWARMFPKILEPVVSMPALGPIQKLLDLPQPGDRVDIAIPPISAPSDSEIRELEIELNNLLIRDRSGKLNNYEESELHWILRAFLPPALKTLEARRDELSQQYVTMPGLNLGESIEYISSVKRYDSEFVDFKSKFPRYGIFLDKWWYSSEAISEACARARMWKEAAENSQLSLGYPMTSRIIEDEDLRQWHELYLELREYADQEMECVIREERLLFPSMSPRLLELRDEVRKANLQPLSNIALEPEKALRAAAWHQRAKGKFIRAWVDWIITIPV